MTNLPDFLPAMLNLDGKSWDVILEELYSLFERDFKTSVPLYQDIPVIYDNRINPESAGKEEGFWHLIEKDQNITGERCYDIKRAERLPWIRAILESFEENCLLVFDYDHCNRDGIKRYLWLKELDYVVILKERNDKWFIVTAFYVDCGGKREDLLNKYKKRLGS